MSDPIQKLEKNIAEVKRLLEIHKELSGDSSGRKHNVEVLNKSSIVLLVACWEAFIEDLASAAFEAMLARATTHTIFPTNVLTSASKSLKADLDASKVWKLAGSGWIAVMTDHKAELFKEYIGKLNTPKPKQIDGLFSTLIGIPSVSAGWSWHRCSANQAATKLTKLVELRGGIAHRVAASQSVHKSTVLGYMWFVYRLSVISSNRVRDFVHSRTKHHPWPMYKFRNTQ